MDEIFYQRIKEWHQAGENQQIIDCILQVPPEDRDYRLTSLLARAYINMEDGEHWQEALQLLLDLEPEGKNDYLWYIRIGGVHARLLHEAEAEDWFRRGLALLDPASDQYREQSEQCSYILRLCRTELAAHDAWERYQDSLDPAKALDYLLHGLLPLELLPTESRAEGDTLFLPELDIRILPQVESIKPQGVVLNFWLECPRWDKRLFECSTAMGSAPGLALGVSVRSFIDSFINGLFRMLYREGPREVSSQLDGRVHRWELYPSSIIGMGAAPRPEGQVWWDALGDELRLRLGNQRICYVKIYGAKVNGEVTGECRIDDIKSEELSARVAELVEQWPEVSFASQKQFFFLRQREETLLPYRYAGPEGQELLRRGVIRGAQLFHACRSEEDYDLFVQRLAEEIGDRTLAEECLTFLPEICAQIAFPQLRAAETVEICREGQEGVMVYKNQLAEYYGLRTVFFTALDDGALGNDPNTVYRELVGYSSTYQALREMQQQGMQAEECQLTTQVFQVGSDFEIR